jgi:sigma-E factor negative regulatory protein RseB
MGRASASEGRTRGRLLAVALGLGVTLAGLTHGYASSSGEDAAYRWLERMREAAATLNYEGVFVYRRDDHIETIRVIHRVTDSGEQQRLTSLNGAPREVLRDGKAVTCIRSDSRSVLVDETGGHGVMAAALRQADDRLWANYRLTLGGNERVAGRLTRELRIEPTDHFRYGFRLWLDEQSGLLLKSSLVNTEGDSVEEYMFTSIDLLASIPDSELQPEVAAQEFDRRTTAPSDDARAGSASTPDLPWSVGWLPAGFAKKGYAREALPGSAEPVDHLVYTDGLAAFSVYVERANPHHAPFEGISRMGAMAAFGRRLGDLHVTVLGEVPVITVERVGQSIDRQR